MCCVFDVAALCVVVICVRGCCLLYSVCVFV